MCGAHRLAALFALPRYVGNCLEIETALAGRSYKRILEGDLRWEQWARWFSQSLRFHPGRQVILSTIP